MAVSGRLVSLRARWAARAFGLMQQSHPLLDKTGRMLNSIRARATTRGVTVTAVDYAGYHQDGTSNMVARRIVPDAAMGLGPIWGNAIGRVAADVARGALGGTSGPLNSIFSVCESLITGPIWQRWALSHRMGIPEPIDSPRWRRHASFGFLRTRMLGRRVVSAVTRS